MKVWINGSFDVVHLGHIKLLEYARSFGTLCVGLDTDERIREFKGENRPYHTLADRMEFISSIRYVDHVVSFGSDDELEQRIREWDSDIMVVGDEYKIKRVIGSHLVERVMFFPKLEGRSTTKILSYDKNISNRGTL